MASIITMPAIFYTYPLNPQHKIEFRGYVCLFLGSQYTEPWKIKGFLLWEAFFVFPNLLVSI